MPKSGCCCENGCGRNCWAGIVASMIRDSLGAVLGPGSKFREGCSITSAPLVAVKIGTRLISACGCPMASQGIQMLYDAPSSVGVKCDLNCSGVKANLRSGTLLS